MAKGSGQNAQINDEMDDTTGGAYLRPEKVFPLSNRSESKCKFIQEEINHTQSIN